MTNRPLKNQWRECSLLDCAMSKHSTSDRVASHAISEKRSIEIEIPVVEGEAEIGIDFLQRLPSLGHHGHRAHAVRGDAGVEVSRGRGRGTRSCDRGGRENCVLRLRGTGDGVRRRYLRERSIRGTAPTPHA